MRNYQRKRNNPYRLPHNVYMQTLYIIRDRDRLQRELQHIREAPEMEAVSERIRAIDEGIASVPEEYRQGVFRSIAYGDPYPITAGEATWRRWRSRMAYYVAKNLKLLY